ncbi:MAG: RNA-binding transcriptional accessory protein [Lentisphaerae bacterium RIFOXYA12_FULL_48_11]|nr:MAG: RNA-binding transcriptional accessory protein [Lentisphaerae bacterium RIFOXYA12_FULL_48_11]
MNEKHIEIVSKDLKITSRQVLATAALIEGGATVPFIARYRKEWTGELDEVAITGIRDKLAKLQALDERRTAIIKSLEERELLTDELKKAIAGADTMAVLEDIYLPYRPKRRTRATIAKEKGLEPLAKLLFDQALSIDPAKVASEYVSLEKKVENVAEALAGARDIISEWINEDTTIRKEMRSFFEKKGKITCGVVKGKDIEGAKFRDYFNWSEPVSDAPSHRLLAMFRGEKEGFLSFSILPPEDEAIAMLSSRVVKGVSAAAKQVREAAEDCYKRLLSPSMEVETRISARDRADVEAIRVFAENLRELLMSSPLGQKAVLALDPGFRTGCKTVCLDPQGKLLFNTVMHLTSSPAEAREAEKVLPKLCDHFKIEAIAIGNGTASRETEAFVRSIKFAKPIPIIMVNESGASIYSASEVARKEFPDHDVTVRGAVSIGRRLMDPLAELVKIDPKSIGVGQYQHDVDQSKLKDRLDDTVMSCVNNVGVEVNTASEQLLTYVSGLGPVMAKNIVKHRDENGPFKSRTEIKKVPRLGAKAFEQCAGFLRVRVSKNPLDASAVHPESYDIVDQMAKDIGCSVADLMKDASLRAKIDLKKYVTDKVGLPTLNDIMAELAKPGRDPRQQFEVFSFAEGVHEIKDLMPGMKLPGIVTNVTNFGAFVDIGVHQDGLVHISELADQFVKSPMDVAKVGQKVNVTVMEVDPGRKRISLSMKQTPGQAHARGVGQTGPKAKTEGRKPVQSGSFSNPFADAFSNL